MLPLPTVEGLAVTLKLVLKVGVQVCGLSQAVLKIFDLPVVLVSEVFCGPKRKSWDPRGRLGRF